jgi:hypothetical protein
MGKDFSVELQVEVLAVSDNSIKVQVDDVEDPVWLPKSEIDQDSSDIDPYACEKGDHGTLYIPEWLATNEGLV